MIRTLIKIGKACQELYPEPLLENPYPGVENKDKALMPRVICCFLKSEPGCGQESAPAKYSLTHLELMDFDSTDFLKYAYREPFTNKHPSYSLSFKYPGKLSSLKIRLKIFEQLNWHLNLSLDDLAQTIKDYYDKISQDLKRGTQIFVTFKINNQWPRFIPGILDRIKKAVFEDLAKYRKKKLWRQQGHCHGCGKETIIYGGVGSLLKFYTVDKYGYAPFLNPVSSWKQYGLCEECIFNLERGKRAADEFLTFRFYGKPFWLLPVAENDIFEIINQLRSFYQSSKSKIHKDDYECVEDRIIYEATVQQNVISYHFCFFSRENQALRIFLHLDEVLPSVLQQYLELKNKLERQFQYSLNLNYRIFFKFFSDQDLKRTKIKQGFTDKDIFELIDSVFRRSIVHEKVLLARAMSRIRQDILTITDKETIKVPWKTVLTTLLGLEFLLFWGILKRQKGRNNMDNLPYNEFFQEHADFFNHPAKKGLVLLGVLVQQFLNHQYKERNSTPFLKLLKNLKLTQKDIQSIFVSLQNKMNEYSIGHWWPRLRQSISLCFIQAGDAWPLSVDEIGFYLAVGMSLYSLEVFYDKSGTDSKN